MEDLQKQVDDMQDKIKDISSKYEDKIHSERQILKKEISKYKVKVVDLNENMKEQDEVIRNQEIITTRWMTRFAQIAYLANEAIDDIPHLLREAEAMMDPFNTPREIKGFICHCKELIGEMMDMIARDKKEYL
ncbi:unnamed protein product [Lupinus luteus]|uniref:Uncharacterized protein n=1 Tax=Lupinus luteus TaxID=3873 RepID=A0AAV1XPN9_LUPLU